MQMKEIKVVAAVIRKGDCILATQRGYGEYKDWWEFPGGKMEPGESPEDALGREIMEELSIGIEVGELLRTVEWDYPKFHLSMRCYLCSLDGGYFHLNEHESARWLDYPVLHDVRWLPADEGILPLLSSILLDVDPGLADYIETAIIPRYASFDMAHREDHARAVISRALSLASNYDVSRDMVYAAAACHDLGLSVDRKTHHIESGRMIRQMQELKRWFGRDEIEEIAMAAEDHRASSDHDPRSLLGRIVAEADRLIVPEQIIRRTIQFGLSNYPELPQSDHWHRTLDHLHEKYDYGGYLKLWIPESPNAAKLEELRGIIHDEPLLHDIFDRIYQELTHGN